jgi:hypothetical protein
MKSDMHWCQQTGVRQVAVARVTLSCSVWRRQGKGVVALAFRPVSRHLYPLLETQLTNKQSDLAELVSGQVRVRVRV